MILRPTSITFTSVLTSIDWRRRRSPGRGHRFIDMWKKVTTLIIGLSSILRWRAGLTVNEPFVCGTSRKDAPYFSPGFLGFTITDFSRSTITNPGLAFRGFLTYRFSA